MREMRVKIKALESELAKTKHSTPSSDHKKAPPTRATANKSPKTRAPSSDEDDDRSFTLVSRGRSKSPKNGGRVGKALQNKSPQPRKRSDSVEWQEESPSSRKARQNSSLPKKSNLRFESPQRNPTTAAGSKLGYGNQKGKGGRRF